MKLAIGSIITFYADARDFDSIKGPNVGKSRELRLRIVSKEDAARQLDDGRRELREEIARILAMQRQAITPVEEAARTLSRTDRLPRPQRENLNNAGLIQRQVGSRMSNRDEGLEQKLRRLLDDLRNFKIANPEAQQQMQNMLERLNMLRERNVGAAEQALTRAGKSLEQSAEPSPGSAASKDEPAKISPEQPQGEKEQTSSHTAGKESKEQSPSQAARQRELREGAQAAGKETKSNPSQAAGKGAQKGAPAGEPKDQAGAANRPQENKPAGEQPAQAGPESQPQNQPPPSPQDIARRSLAEAKTNQKAIAEELQKMLEGLGEFETYRAVVKDAQALLKKQEETMKQAAEAATKPDLMGKSAESLSQEQKADLGNLPPASRILRRTCRTCWSGWTTWASDLMSPIRWPPLRCATLPATVANRAPPPRWAKPPSGSKRTRWARLGSSRIRPARNCGSSSTPSRTVANASFPAW